MLSAGLMGLFDDLSSEFDSLWKDIDDLGEVKQPVEVRPKLVRWSKFPQVTKENHRDLCWTTDDLFRVPFSELEFWEALKELSTQVVWCTSEKIFAFFATDGWYYYPFAGVLMWKFGIHVDSERVAARTLGFDDEFFWRMYRASQSMGNLDLTDRLREVTNHGKGD